MKVVTCNLEYVFVVPNRRWDLLKFRRHRVQRFSNRYYRESFYRELQFCLMSVRQAGTQVVLIREYHSGKDTEFMTKTYYLIALLGLLLYAASSTAQQAPQIDIDYASFAYDEQESLVELYMAVEARSLTYEEGDSLYTSTIPLELSLLSSSDTDLDASAERVVWEQEMDLQFAVMDPSVITEGQVFLRQVRLTVVPGEYELQIAMPLSGQDPVQASRDVIIPDYGQQESCSISDITLASRITPSEDREDPFFKNGLHIRPNASQLYGEGATNLFYYAEAYNTACAASGTDEYTMLIYVSEANRPAPLTGLQKRSNRPVRLTDVLVGRFNLAPLVSGTYFLHMVILDNANESKVEQARKFFVFNPSADSALAQPVVATETFETSGYASMPEEEVEQGLEHIQIIATEQELRRIRNVEDLNERRRLLMDFWLVRDPTPRTGVNEYRDEFYSLLMYANERYSVQRIDGWETDRGRILIKYGRPSAIEQHQYDRGFKPYEIWNYNNISGEGQAMFVFADLDGFGEYELIHSTVAGERKLPDWIRRISESY